MDEVCIYNEYDVRIAYGTHESEKGTKLTVFLVNSRLQTPPSPNVSHHILACQCLYLDIVCMNACMYVSIYLAQGFRV